MVKQSFSGRVKAELSQIQAGKSDAAVKAELAAIIVTCGIDGAAGSDGGAALPLHKQYAAKRLDYLVRQLGIHPGELPEKLGISSYMEYGGLNLMPCGLTTGINNIKAFIRGSFICAGSISDPSRAYHMELATHDGQLMCIWVDMFNRLKIPARQTARAFAKTEAHVLYVKEADGIARFLAMTGAGGAYCEYENAILLRSLRNQANRAANCDSANTDKSVDTAGRQLMAIERLINTVGLSSLPPHLADAAIKRLENPDLPLGELCALLSPPVGKSGANHRLRRLEQLASEKLYREKRKDNDTQDNKLW